MTPLFLDFSKPKFSPKDLIPQNSFERELIVFFEKWEQNSHIEVCTSGSTGTPKPIRHSKEAMIKSAEMTGNYFNLQKGDIALLCLPIDKIAGMMMFVRAWTLKLKLYCVPPSLFPMKTLDCQIDFAAMIPAQVANSLSQLTQIKQLLIGGAPLSFELETQLSQSPTQSFLSYGMTETITHVAIRTIGATPFFEALPGVHFCTNKEGCLLIEASHLPSSIQTHDLVQLKDSRHFRWLGRKDTVINSGGIKLIPEQLEKEFAPFLSLPFFLTGTPHPKLGQQLTLVIEGEIWTQREIEKLQQQLTQHLHKHHLPKKVLFQKEFCYQNQKLIRKL